MNNKDLRLAVLIDADNVPSRSVKEMMEEMSKYGTPTFKRIYGDWTNTALSGWKQVLNEHAIVPVQQFSYTSGKNSTDSALIIDAMDILYTRRVDGFFIVSSDSDFTRLATRLREEGMRVFGMGERKTAVPFIKACEKFIYIEVLRPEPVAARSLGKGQPVQKPKAFRDPELEALVISTIEDMADDAGWVDMGGLGNGLLKKRSDFDPRNYGFKKLTDLIMAMHGVVVEARSTGQGNVKHYYLRLKS
ncbi:MAG: NYN domain-containing protein [Flavobacteriales bacterium]